MGVAWWIGGDITGSEGTPDAVADESPDTQDIANEEQTAFDVDGMVQTATDTITDTVTDTAGTVAETLEGLTDSIIAIDPNTAAAIAQQAAAEADRIAADAEAIAERIAAEEAEAKRILYEKAAEAEARMAQKRAEAKAAEMAAWPDKISIIEDTIYELTNQHRQATGLPPLIRDAKIDTIARSHSQDMANRNYFSHDTPEGWDPTDRGNAVRYDCRKDHGSYYTYGLAENIHGITHHWVGSDMEQVGRILVDGGGGQMGWMDSHGHRANILDPQYDRIGIGVAVNHDNEHNDGRYILATQNFC